MKSTVHHYSLLYENGQCYFKAITFVRVLLTYVCVWATCEKEVPNTSKNNFQNALLAFNSLHGT